MISDAGATVVAFGAGVAMNYLLPDRVKDEFKDKVGL